MKNPLHGNDFYPHNQKGRLRKRLILKRIGKSFAGHVSLQSKIGTDQKDGKEENPQKSGYAGKRI